MSKSNQHAGVPALIIVCCSFLSSEGWAETKVLLLDGGGDAQSNYYRYYNNTRSAYEVSKSLGYATSVYAKDGSWKVTQQGKEDLSNFSLTSDGTKNGNSKGKANKKPTYPPIQGPLRSTEDMTNAIQALKLKPGDRLIIQMTGHGGQTAQGEAGYWFFGGEGDTWTGIGQALQKVSPKVTIQIQASSCYAGGVHVLARKFPNLCSVSTSQSYSVSNSDNDGDIFTSTFWNHFKSKSGSAAFAEASMEGFKNDDANPGQGSLSSFDYIAFVLKKSPYDKVKYKVFDDKNGFDSRYSPILAVNPSESQQTKGCDLNGFPKAVSELSKTLNSLGTFINSNNVKEVSTPLELPSGFSQMLKEFTGVEDPNYKEYLKQKAALKKEWDDHQSKFKDSWTITKWWYNEGDKRAEIEKRISALDQKYLPLLAKDKYFQDKLSGILSSLKEFNSKATPAQKKKLNQLLSCEWGTFKK